MDGSRHRPADGPVELALLRGAERLVAPCGTSSQPISLGFRRGFQCGWSIARHAGSSRQTTWRWRCSVRTGGCPVAAPPPPGRPAEHASGAYRRRSWTCMSRCAMSGRSSCRTRAHRHRGPRARRGHLGQPHQASCSARRSARRERSGVGEHAAERREERDRHENGLAMKYRFVPGLPQPSGMFRT